MIIGVPKEIKTQEHRVGIVPAGVHGLVQRKHTVLVQAGAGVGSGFPDEQYVNAGATIINTAEEIFERAQMIVKVKEPLKPEWKLLRPGQILFTYLHYAASKELTEAVAKSGATSLAYEMVQIGRRLPLLEPMSEIAGRMSVLMGGYFLTKHHGGRGVLLGGIPGVIPGRVVIIGGGSAGFNAARVAAGLGAEVIVLEVDAERMRYIDNTLPGVRTSLSTEPNLLKLLPDAHVVIGAVLVPGTKAPRLITRATMRKMLPGSVFVDIAIDQGGCAETSRPTTHEDPIYTEEGVVHYCVANMPGAYARTASQGLMNATYRYIEAIADKGLEAAAKKMPELVPAISTMGGRLTCPIVAKAHDLPCVPVDEMMGGMPSASRQKKSSR